MADPLDAREHAGAHALGRLGVPGGAQAAPAQPRVERPDRAAVVATADRSRDGARDSVRSPKSVSTSGSARRSAARGAISAARRPTAASRAASPRPRTGPVVGVERHRLGVRSRADARRERLGGVRVARGRPTAAPARAARRAPPPACRRRPPAARGPSRPRAGCRCPATRQPYGSTESRQPCWTSPPGAPPVPAQQAAAALQRAEQPVAGGAPRGLELGGQAASPVVASTCRNSEVESAEP